MTSRTLAASGVAVALGLLGGAGPSTVAAQQAWDLAVIYPDGNFIVESHKRFAEEVERVTDGEVVITVHSGGSLGFRGPELMDVVGDGIVAMADIPLNLQLGEEPILALEAQPFLVSDFDELEILHEHFRPVIEDTAARRNQKTLYVIPWPQQYTYTKQPIESLEDLHGIRIRTVSATTSELFERLGMVSVLLPWGEAVPALAAGTVNAAATSASSGVDGNFWEFMTHMYPTNHVWNSNALNVNLDAWNALAPEHREAIEALATELEPQFWDVSRGEDAEKRAMLEENGVVVGSFTPEMNEEMRRLTAPMIEEFLDENGDRARAIVEAYREDLAARD